MREVLLSIHPRWTRQIYSGLKTLELRKGLPRLPFRVLFLETGGEKSAAFDGKKKAELCQKLITGEAVVSDAAAHAPMAGEPTPDWLLEGSRASEAFIRGYAGDGHLFAWYLTHVRKYPRPRVWKGQSPQSYQCLGSGEA